VRVYCSSGNENERRSWKLGESLKQVATTALLLASLSANASVRFYMAYGSPELAALNSGAVGSEISQQSPLRVLPGHKFKVQMWMENTQPGLTRATYWSTNVAFDRSLRADSEEWDFLDQHAFRKIRPAYSDYSDCVSNYANFPAFTFFGNPIDLNSDGVQDTAAWEPINDETFSIYGTQGPGVTVRPVGLGATMQGVNQDVRELASAFLPAGRHRLWDYEFTNAMAPGETYGFGQGETGLTITTGVSNGTNGATWFPNSQNISFSGGRYNILAVPEPSSLLALGAGLLLLRKRR